MKEDPDNNQHFEVIHYVFISVLFVLLIGIFLTFNIKSIPSIRISGNKPDECFGILDCGGDPFLITLIPGGTVMYENGQLMKIENAIGMIKANCKQAGRSCKALIKLNESQGTLAGETVHLIDLLNENDIKFLFVKEN